MNGADFTLEAYRATISRHGRVVGEVTYIATREYAERWRAQLFGELPTYHRTVTDAQECLLKKANTHAAEAHQ